MPPSPGSSGLGSRLPQDPHASSELFLVDLADSEILSEGFLCGSPTLRSAVSFRAIGKSPPERPEEDADRQ